MDSHGAISAAAWTICSSFRRHLSDPHSRKPSHLLPFQCSLLLFIRNQWEHSNPTVTCILFTARLTHGRSSPSRSFQSQTLTTHQLNNCSATQLTSLIATHTRRLKLLARLRHLSLSTGAFPLSQHRHQHESVLAQHVHLALDTRPHGYQPRL
jgi:hypothetical protein